MEIAAFSVACVAALLSAMSIGWQVFTWRRDHRCRILLYLRGGEVALGGGRYPLHLTAANRGGSTEWIEELWIEVTYERSETVIFYAPELVRNPSRDRELAPGQRFASEFNLLSKLIAARGLPQKVEGHLLLASGREFTSTVYVLKPAAAEQALEERSSSVDLAMEELDDYFPLGPHQICPDCRSEIPSDARVCAVCGHRLKNAPKSPRQEKRSAG